MRAIDYSADIVAQLQDACDFATEPRELERLCGNARIEIVKLRALLRRIADQTMYSANGRTVIRAEIIKAIGPEDPLAWSKAHGVEEF